MTTYSYDQLKALAVQVGVPANAAPAAAAIALAESHGESNGAPGDVGIEDATWGPSVGLWQIRSLKAQKGTGGTRDELANVDPLHNAKAMASISSGGTNFGPWTTFDPSPTHPKNTGAYRQFMPSADVTLFAGSKAAGNVKASGGGGNWWDTVTGAVGGAASAVGGALSAPLSGIEAVGSFFVALTQWATWLRVLQIVGGFILIGVGLFLLAYDNAPAGAKTAALAAVAA